MSLLKAAVVAISLTVVSPLVPVRAQQTKAAPIVAPQPASDVLKAAQKQAQSSGKQVLVVFHASWCGWCKRLDAKLLDDPATSKLLSTHYVIVHLDVMEHGEQKSLENPGADTVLTTLGGAKAGLPFYAVLDTKGKKQSDSLQMPGDQNIGYPGAPEEITAFISILKKTAPRMTEAERKLIADHLTKNAPKA